MGHRLRPIRARVRSCRLRRRSAPARVVAQRRVSVTRCCSSVRKSLTESPSPGGTSTSASLGRSTPDTRNSGGIPHNDLHNKKTVKPAWNESFTNQEGAGGDYQSGAQDHQPRHDEGRMKSSSARPVVWGVRLERSVVRGAAYLRRRGRPFHTARPGRVFAADLPLSQSKNAPDLAGGGAQ
jgi:hypothetical protein